MKNSNIASDENLSEIMPDTRFHFGCGPQLPCYNRCCADITLPLTPYDVLRITGNANMPSEDFLKTFTDIHSIPESGFPLPFLRMVQGPEALCPFVSAYGCAIYEDRPGACRSFPIGRGSKINRDGIGERFFLIKEDYCKGFECGPEWTPAKWLKNENMDKYNHFNDRYMHLMSLVEASRRPLSGRLATMTLLCLYQIDKFRELIRKMDIFAKVHVSKELESLVMEDSTAGKEACLDFSFDWVELIIFGRSENLHKKEC